MNRVKLDVHLVDTCRRATALAENVLQSRVPLSICPEPQLALAAVPTPDLATGAERHELGLAAVRKVHEMLGSGAAHSVSHTRAVSVVVATKGPYLGIDVERLLPERSRIARRILTSRELDEFGSAPTWQDILRCFCVKEATYKVLDDIEQQGLRFRGLRLEDARQTTGRVHRVTDGRCVAHTTAALGTEVLVALATPCTVGNASQIHP